MRVAVFGLGEAGSEISRDLAAAGIDVTGYDPAEVDTPLGVQRSEDPELAVVDAEIVVALTASVDAGVALAQALNAIPGDAIYADMSTSSPGKKRDLAHVASAAQLRFVDIALMSTVPGKGISTPMLASGAGAEAFASWAESLGATVDAVGDEAGTAATRKLLRSVVIKGVAAVLIESMRGAHEAGLAVETWRNVMGQLVDADEAFIRRMFEGTGPHARRRRDEMVAAAELLDELGVESVMTRATVQNLEAVLEAGLPDLPDT